MMTDAMQAVAFLSRASSNPAGLFASCLSVIPVCIAGVWIVRSMVDRDLDFGIGVLAIFGLLLILQLINAPPYPWMSPVLFALLVLALLAVPTLSRIGSEVTLRDMDTQALEASYTKLRLNPNDFLSLARTARLLDDVGLRPYALGLMYRAVSLAPRNSLTDEASTLKLWQMDPRPVPAIACKCHTVPEVGEIFCPNCRKAHVLEHVQSHVGRRRSGMQLVAAWGLGVLMILVMIGSTAYGTGAIFVTVPLTLLAGAFLAWRIWQEGRA